MSTQVDPTEVFAPSAGAASVAAFLCRRRRGLPDEICAAAAHNVRAELDRLAVSGWTLSVDGLLGDTDEPAAFDAGFSSDLDVVGAFEAPTLSAAVAGTAALEQAGWDTLFTTEWLIGPREFASVSGDGSGAGDAWGFLALWEWNDAWQAATNAERREYDADCDIAFAADVAAGVSISGRHRLDWASRWHQLGIWRISAPRVVDTAMREHERVADFKLTTSRHYLGRRRSLLDVLGGPDA